MKLSNPLNITRVAMAAIVIAGSVALAPSPATAQEAAAATETSKEINAKETVGKDAGTAAVDQAALAIQLAMKGIRVKSPTLILAAAELMGPLTESDQEIPSAEKPDTDRGDKTPVDLSYTGLLDQALEMAQGDETMLPLVKARVEAMRSGKGLVAWQGSDLESVSIRGETFKVLDRDVIGAGTQFTYKKFYFEAGRPAKVSVIGDDDGDLDMWIYDANTGGLIDKDTDSTSTCICTWEPRYEGPFTIRVSNVGSIAERYVVVANW